MSKEKNIQKLALIFIVDRTEKTFKDLYDRLRPGVLNHCVRIIKDRDLAEDAFINCMSKIWLKVDQYNEERGNFSTWCYNIARNECYLLLKNRKKYVNQTEEDVEYKAIISSEVEIYNPEDDPEWIFNNDEKTIDDIYDDVIDEIKNLPELYREIMIDREIEGMKYKDIAVKYGIKKRSIATRIRRARSKIRKKMENYSDIEV